MDYFKHDINASEDDKICDLLASGGYELLGYYWRFIEYLYSRGGKASKKNLNGIAWSLHMDIDKLSTVICNFDLFFEDDLYIYSKRVLTELEGFEAVGKRMAEIGKAGGQASAQARAKRAVEEIQPKGKRALNHTVSESSSESQADAQACAQQNKRDKIKEKKENRIDKIECDNAPAHGKYKNVILSEEELALLMNRYPKDYQDKIERLSKYMADTGRSYASHYDTIVEWAEKDAQKESKAAGAEDNGLKSFETDDFFQAAMKKSYRDLNGGSE